MLLHRGTLFGELGAIKEAPRAATAIAHSSLRLLAVKCDNFKRNVVQNPQLQQVMSTLQQTYEIPRRGIVDQYIGNVQGKGDSITNIYKLEDGRIVTSAKLLKQDIFTMATSNVKSEMCYQYKKDSVWIELDVTDNRLVGIRAYGLWGNLPDLCELLFDNKIITETAFEKFVLTGVLDQLNEKH